VPQFLFCYLVLVFQIHLIEVLSARPHELVLVLVFQIHLFQVTSPKNSLVLFSVCFLFCLSKLDERGCLCCFRCFLFYLVLVFQIHLFQVISPKNSLVLFSVYFLFCLSKLDERGCLCCFRCFLFCLVLVFQIHLFQVLLSCVTKWVYLLFEFICYFRFTCNVADNS
jgi:hypothetical protein